DPVLARGLAAIEPYLDVVLVAGGWVPHVYELLYDANTAGLTSNARYRSGGAPFGAGQESEHR
ncbi:MAG: hypothetical protein U1E22_07745, partial [Coriobacteriia bacterium]|nr:hypothetical protein [Coriobacteriia bacterium]